MIGDVGFARRGQQAPADRWTLDFRKGWLPPGTDADRNEMQVVMPDDFNPLEATRKGFHVLKSPAGVQAPVEHINYTPQTNEVHDRGARAPMQYENLSLIPEGGDTWGSVGKGEDDISDVVPGGGTGPALPFGETYFDPQLNAYVQKDTLGQVHVVRALPFPSQTQQQPDTQMVGGTLYVRKPGTNGTNQGDWVPVISPDATKKPTNITWIHMPDGSLRLGDDFGATYDPQTGRQLTPGVGKPGAQSGSAPASAPTTQGNKPDPHLTPSGRTFTNEPLEAYARAVAVENGLDPDIFAAQIQQESGFRHTNPDGTPLTSKAGAQGIAQFMPGTARDVAKALGITPEQMLSDPRMSLQGAGLLMHDLLKKTGGDYAKALAAYNSGDYEGASKYDETSKYVSTIMGQKRAIQSGSAGIPSTGIAPITAGQPPTTVSGGVPGSANPFDPNQGSKPGTFVISGGRVLNTATGESRPVPQSNDPQVVGNQIVQRNPQTGTFEVVYEAPTNMQLQAIGNNLIAFNPRTGTGTVVAQSPAEVKYQDHVFFVPAGTKLHYTTGEGKNVDIGSYDNPHGLKVGDTVGFGNPTIDKQTGAVMDSGKPTLADRHPVPGSQSPVSRDLSATSSISSADNDLVNSRIGNPQQPTAAEQAGRRPSGGPPQAAPMAAPQAAYTPPNIAPPNYTPGATLSQEDYYRQVPDARPPAEEAPQTVLAPPDVSSDTPPPSRDDWSVRPGEQNPDPYGLNEPILPPSLVPQYPNTTISTQQPNTYGPWQYPPPMDPDLVGGGEDQWSDPQATQQAAQAPPDGWTPPIPPDQIVGGGNKFGEGTPLEGVHEGTDLQAYQGTPALSPVNGVVVDINNEPEGLGLQVAIRDSSGQIHRLSHLLDIGVKLGQEVIAGDQVGSVGASGAGATGPHLDYRVEDQTGARMNPEPMMGDLAQLPPHPDTIERGSPEDMGMQQQPGMGEDPRMRRSAGDLAGPDPNAQPEAQVWVGPSDPGAWSDDYPTEQQLQDFGPSDEANFPRDSWTQGRQYDSQFPMEYIQPGQQRYDAEGNYADPNVVPIPLNPYGPMHDPLGMGEDGPFGGQGDPWSEFLPPQGEFGSPSSMREHLEGQVGLRPMTQSAGQPQDSWVGVGENDVYSQMNPDYYKYLMGQLQNQANATKSQASSQRYSADTSKAIAKMNNDLQKWIAQMQHDISQQQVDQQGHYYDILDNYYQGQLTNQGRQLDLTQQDINFRHQDLQDQLKLGYAQLQQSITAEAHQHEVNMANALTADAQERENERHNAVTEGLAKATMELQAHESSLDRANQRVIQGTFGQQTQAKLLQSALSNPWVQNLSGMAPGYGKPGWNNDSGGALSGFLKSWNPQQNVLQGIAGDYEALQNDTQSGGQWSPNGGWGFMDKQARPSTVNFSTGGGSVGQQMGATYTPGNATTVGFNDSPSQHPQFTNPNDVMNWIQQNEQQANGYGTGEDTWVGYGEATPAGPGLPPPGSPTTGAPQLNGNFIYRPVPTSQFGSAGGSPQAWAAELRRQAQLKLDAVTKNKYSPYQAQRLTWDGKYLQKFADEVERMAQYGQRSGTWLMPVPETAFGYSGSPAYDPYWGKVFQDNSGVWKDAIAGASTSHPNLYQNTFGTLFDAPPAAPPPTEAPPPGTPPNNANSGGVGGGNIGGQQPAAGGGQGSQAGAGWGGYGLYANPPTDMSFDTWQQLTPYEQASYRTIAEASEPWAQAQQQLREKWASEGVYNTPGTSPLSIATWTPEQRMAKENTASVFGETPDNYWQRQNKDWQKTAASAVSQST